MGIYSKREQSRRVSKECITDITDNSMLSQPLNLNGVNKAVSSSQVSFVSGQLSEGIGVGVSQNRGPMPPPSPPPGADVNLAWPRVNIADSMTVSPTEIKVTNKWALRTLVWKPSRYCLSRSYILVRVVQRVQHRLRSTSRLSRLYSLRSAAKSNDKTRGPPSTKGTGRSQSRARSVWSRSRSR